jgi:hypothetical protein
MDTETKMRLPVHVPQGRPQVRTKNPRRPEWLDRLKRPLQIAAQTERQFERFRDMWRFDHSECRHVLLTKDIEGMPISIPILVLPGAFDPTPTLIADFCPLRWWRAKGGVTIDIPENAMEKPFEFTLEDNMAASTLIAIAQHRHLDNLNRK